MSKKIGLREAIALMDSIDDPMELMQSKELEQFLDDVQDAGQEILSPLDREYLKGAISLLKAASLSGLISVGGNPLLALSLVESRDYDLLVTILFKFCVGLSAIEELR